MLLPTFHRIEKDIQRERNVLYRHLLGLVNGIKELTLNRVHQKNYVEDTINPTSYKHARHISIINSYATPFFGELLIMGTNGYITIKNEILEVRTPRDTFDKNNFFITPPIFFTKKFNMQNDYNSSLKNSFDFFILHVINKKDFDISLCQTSLKTTQSVLKLRSKE